MTNTHFKFLNEVVDCCSLQYYYGPACTMKIFQRSVNVLQSNSTIMVFTGFPTFPNSIYNGIECMEKVHLLRSNS